MRKVFFKRATALTVAVLMLFSGFATCVFAGEDTEIYESHDIVKEDFEDSEVGATEFDNIKVAIKTDKNESGTILATEYGQDKDKVLKYTKIKRYKHKVNVKTHYNIDYYYRKNYEVHKVECKASAAREEKDKINTKNYHNNCVNKSHNQALLEVSFDSVKEIRKYEYGLTSV